MGLKDSRCPGLELSLDGFPEIFPCPECGNEIEIWSDERKRKCSFCNQMVDPRISVVTMPASKKRKYQVTVKEYEDPSGSTLYYEHYETIIPLSFIDHNSKYKIACEACHKYGKNYACPPYSPDLNMYLDGQEYVHVICVRMPQEYFRDVIQEKIYRECFRKARSILVEELLRYREQGYSIAGSGFCLACDLCAVEEHSDRCKKPEKMVYSLESMGVNLTALTKACFDFDLEWSANDHGADFVCSLGAIFLHNHKHTDYPDRPVMTKGMGEE